MFRRDRLHQLPSRVRWLIVALAMDLAVVRFVWRRIRSVEDDEDD